MFFFTNRECYLKHTTHCQKGADTWHRSARSIVTLLRNKSAKGAAEYLTLAEVIK